MTDLSIDEFRAEATAFLEANASLKPEATAFRWGEGSDDVALFERLHELIGPTDAEVLIALLPYRPFLERKAASARRSA